MAGETILVIDAGQEIDQRITTTLEAKDYLVFTDSSRVVSAEIAEQLKPSLIYIKPLELSAAGFEPCRAIHATPLLKDVPIVILASLKEALNRKDDPRYFRDYGIVDFLKLTFDPDELIKKTEEILGKTHPSKLHEENASVLEDHLSPQATVKGMRKKRSPLLLPAIGAAVLLVIAAVGFLVYQQLMPARKALPISALTSRLPVPSKVPDTGSKPPLPPGRNVQDASASASPSPPAQPAQAPFLSSAASQPPRKPFYSVQLGAYKNEDYAQVLTKKLQEKGYDAFTQPGLTKDKSPIYRVLVGKYEDRKAAEKAGARN